MTLGTSHHHDMSLPSAFGASWDEFVDVWCLGTAPAGERQTVENNLSALSRIWPENVTGLVAARARGLVVVSPSIETGGVLAACETLDGFQNVLRRLRGGERSARTELTFAARLVQARFWPALEPPLGSRVLDARVQTTEGPVYCEVIAPEASDAIMDAKRTATGLAIRLIEENGGRRIEVLFSADIDEEVSSKVAESVRIRPDSIEIWPVRDIALISKLVVPEGDLYLGPTIPSPEEAAITSIGRASGDRGVRTAAVIRVPVTDRRVKRLMRAESHHFSRDAMNILIIDVTKIVTSFKAWTELIGKCFQPEQNRRFGAVALFSSGLEGVKMNVQQEWTFVRNPYAYKPIPECLLQAIGSP